MLNLEPIKALLAAATPGPWVIPGGPEGEWPFKTWPLSPADADLLNTAPKNMAALIAEVERLRDENEGLLKSLERGNDFVWIVRE